MGRDEVVECGDEWEGEREKEYVLMSARPRSRGINKFPDEKMNTNM